VFVTAAPEGLRAAASSKVDLEPRLLALLQVGRDAWPGVRVEAATFASFVAGRLDAEQDLDDALDGVRATDLYLTCACARGDRAALLQFEQHFIREVDIALARMRIGPPRSNDVKQLVRQRLFVGSDGQSGKIGEYAGRGDLRRWVRAVAVRTCLNDLRKGKHEILVDDDRMMANHAIPDDDPAVAYMKRRYAGEFRAAFAEAMTVLAAREQTLLRYHHVDGLNIDEIGAIYRVHRVTAFRWLEKAKDTLVQAVLENLRQRLRVSAPEMDSVLRLIRSQVHLSLVRHLGGPGDQVHEIDDSDLELVEE
jgi:RNA polymerase sigma-70 factor (ECF subfamily)